MFHKFQVFVTMLSFVAGAEAISEWFFFGETSNQHTIIIIIFWTNEDNIFKQSKQSTLKVLLTFEQMKLQ